MVTLDTIKIQVHIPFLSVYFVEICLSWTEKRHQEESENESIVDRFKGVLQEGVERIKTLKISFLKRASSVNSLVRGDLFWLWTKVTNGYCITLFSELFYFR